MRHFDLLEALGLQMTSDQTQIYWTKVLSRRFLSLAPPSYDTASREQAPANPIDLPAPSRPDIERDSASPSCDSPTCPRGGSCRPSARLRDRWRGRTHCSDVDQLAVDELAEAELGELAAVARILDAAERQLGRSPGGMIDEGHSAFDAPGELLAALEIRGKDRAAEAERRRVRDLDRFLLGLDDIERDDGTEELLGVDRIVLGDSGQVRHHDIEARPVHAAAAGRYLRASGLGRIDLVEETGHRALGRDRAEARVGVSRVARPQGCHPRCEPLEELFAALLADDDHPLGGDAALAGIVHAAPDRVGERWLERGVLKHDERIAAAEFHDGLLERPPGALGDSGAGAFAAGDRRAPNARILDQPADLIGAREDVGVGALRSARLLEDPGDRKSTRLNSSHPSISYAVFCLKKKTIGFELPGIAPNEKYISLDVM